MFFNNLFNLNFLELLSSWIKNTLELILLLKFLLLNLLINIINYLIKIYH